MTEVENISLSQLQNIKVEEFTTPCPVAVLQTANLKEIEKIMKKEGFRHIPVKDEADQIVGILSERDIYFSYRFGDTASIPAKEVMQTDFYKTSGQTKISEVAYTMSKNKYGSALVDLDGEMGIFTSTDALNALVEVVRGDILKDPL